MEKVRPWCGQPSDRGRLRNRNRNGKQPGESVKSVLKKKRAAAVGRICRKGRFKRGMKESERCRPMDSWTVNRGTIKRVRTINRVSLNRGYIELSEFYVQTPDV